jgi:hypothetical protein
MKVKRVLIGTIIWTLGILVPVLQHGIISIVASRAKTHSYDYHNLVKILLCSALDSMALPYRNVAGWYNPCHFRPKSKAVVAVTICF